MALLSRVKTWIAEVLTASDLNAELDNIINNGLKADKIVGSSADTSAMQAVTDPGELGTESLASDVEGEIKRLRNMIKEITGQAQWYISPPRSIDPGGRNVLTSSSSTPDLDDIDILIADTSGGAVTLQGFTNGVANQVVYVVKNDTSNSLTLKDNGSGTQKMQCPANADIVLAAADRGGALLEYDGTSWNVLAVSPITEEAIADNAVTGAKIAANAVDTNEINALAVTDAKVNDVDVQKISNHGTSTTANSSTTSNITIATLSSITVNGNMMVTIGANAGASGTIMDASGGNCTVNIKRDSTTIFSHTFTTGQSTFSPMTVIDTGASGATVYSVTTTGNSSTFTYNICVNATAVS